MADLSDVEAGMLSLAALALYPAGISNPSVAGGATVEFARGWPQRKDLDANMGAGNVLVTAYSAPGAGRNVSRYPREWKPLATQAAATMTAVVSGTDVTIAGVPADDQVVAVVVDKGVAYNYRPDGTDTADDVAAALQAMVPGATVAGAVLTVPGAVYLTARVVPDVVAMRELRRQQQQVMVTVWAPTPALRDLVASTLDTAAAATDWLAMPDQSNARLVYAGTRSSDRAQHEPAYRRDLMFMVEYATTETATTPAMASGTFSLTAPGAATFSNSI